jgi:hypothetical protein
MKRLYTALSDETGPIIKRVRLISSLEINENEEEIISNSSNRLKIHYSIKDGLTFLFLIF